MGPRLGLGRALEVFDMAMLEWAWDKFEPKSFGGADTSKLESLICHAVWGKRR